MKNIFYSCHLKNILINKILHVCIKYEIFWFFFFLIRIKSTDIIHKIFFCWRRKVRFIINVTSAILFDDIYLSCMRRLIKLYVFEMYFFMHPLTGLCILKKNFSLQHLQKFQFFHKETLFILNTFLACSWYHVECDKRSSFRHLDEPIILPKVRTFEIYYWSWM